MSDTTTNQNTNINADQKGNTAGNTASNPNDKAGGIVFLQGRITTLRPLSKADVPTLLRWINDPDVRQYVMGFLPMMEESEYKWLEKLSQNRDTEIALGVEVEGKLIGTMGVHRISWKDRVCTTGAMIGEKEYWGNGYGTDAKMALLNYIFNTLNLRRVLSAVYAFNKRSLHYSLHCGYKVEGVQRKQTFVNGRYVDVIMLGLFKREWLSHWRAYQRGEKLAHIAYVPPAATQKVSRTKSVK